MVPALATTAFQSSLTAPRPSSRRFQVSCAAAGAPAPDRRAVLAGVAGAVLAAPLLAAPPAEAKMVDRVFKADSLSAFQKADVVKDFQSRAVAQLQKTLSAGDAPAALRLLLHDAATYDAASGTGGVNGSVVLSEELARPENAGLKDVLAKIGAAKKALDDARPAGQAALSWADALVLAVKVTQEKAWADHRRESNPINGEKLVAQFSNPIPVRLGRLDAAAPDPAGRVPAPGAPAPEVLAFMGRLGVKDPAALEGPFGRKAPFWARPAFVLWTAAQPDPAAAEAALVAGAPEAFAEWKTKYDRSRATTFRQDYEVDFINYFELLAGPTCGAKFQKDRYVYDVVIKVPDRL